MVHPGSAPLAGRYALDSLLATGGMGQVWRARDLLLHRPVAVKVLRSEFTGDPTFLARFRAEAQHAAVLAHENIASVYDYGEVPADEAGEHLAFLVMELVDGEALSALLAREPRMDASRTLEIVRQTAAALAAAHGAGVVHRDVKPGNVLVRRDGQVKISDFGIAWSASSVPLTKTGQVVGTAHYLSPEQAEGGKASPASDVYALGMIAYECLAGRRAFDGENPVQIALRQIRDVPDPLPADVPDAVRGLVGRALLKDPAERFPDGGALRDAVSAVLAGRPVPSANPGTGGTRPLAAVWPVPPPESAPVPRRRRVLAPAVAMLAGAGIAVGAVGLLGPTVPAPVTAQETRVEDVRLDPDDVVVVAADHIGQPVDDVEAALGALGLRVERDPETTSGVPAGQVLSVSPSGALQRGDTVRVRYAVAAPSTPAPTSVAEPTTRTVEQPTVRAPVPAPQAPAAGRPAAGGSGDDGHPGKGKGKDKGKKGKDGKGKGKNGDG